MPKDTTENNTAPAAGFKQAVEKNIQANEHGVPVTHVGVNRKINIGNYENIDVYSGVSLPISCIENGVIKEEVLQAILDAQRESFQIASSETFDRYKMIKQAQEAHLKQIEENK